MLDMRLHRLTGLEQDKIVRGVPAAAGARFVELSEILARRRASSRWYAPRSSRFATTYGDARRTEINRDQLNLSTEDLIEPQDVVVTLSHAGYAKSQPVSDYQAQRRGGRGRSATAVKDEDFIEKFFVAHTHDTLLCFSNRGKVYWLRVFELPQAGRGSRGKPDRESAAAGRGREDQRRAAGEAVRRAALRVHGHQQRYGQEDAAGGILAAAHQRHHRGWICAATIIWWGLRSPTVRGDHALHQRRQGDPFPRG